MSPVTADVRHPGARPVAAPVLVAATGAVTLLAVLVGSEAETLGAWWPTVGLAVAALLLAPRRRLVPVALAVLAVVAVAGMLGGRAPGFALALAGVDTAAALLVAVVTRRGTAGRLERLGDLVPFLVSVTGGAVVGGLGVATVLSTAADEPFGSTFTVAGLAHAAGLLVLLPLALLDRQEPWSRRRATRVVPLALLVGAVLVLAFSRMTNGLTGLTLLVLPLPLLVLAAVRHEARAVVALLAWCATLVSASVVLSPNTFGPGAAGAASTTQVAQVYLVTLVLLVLPLVLALRERDEAARRTRDSERTFRRAFTQSGLPVLLGRWDGAVLRVSAASDACGGLLGRSPTDLAGVDLADLVAAPGLLEALRGGPLDVVGWSGPLELRADPQRQVEAYASVLDADDERGLLSLHLVDLTEHLSLERRLTDERARSQAVMDTASSLIVITDVEGRVVTVNPETTRLTGWSAEDLVGRPLWETVVAPGDRQAVEDAVTKVLPIPRSGELHLRTRSGAERTVVFTHAVHEGTDDVAPTLVFSGTDVTDARESAEMVEHLLRSVTSIAFVGTDLDGTISLFSAGAERLLGLRADQAAGRSLGSMLAEVDETGRAGDDHGRPRAGVPIARLVGPGSTDGSPRTQDWLALPQARPPVRVSMTCNPVRSAAGTQHGYLFVARDVTDTRRNQEIMVSALRREREVVTRLQELDRAKDDFISTVSHELRTPMSSIIGSAEMLADGMAGELQDSQQQLVDVVIRNGARLLGLADDLLTLATFDRGTPAQPDGHLDLREVVQESLGAVRPHAGDDRLRWHVELPETPVTVIGEASHLERAVTNLLTNAVKFTPAGGSVSVAVRTGAETGLGTTATPGSATITVSDTGRGIPAADLEHVFDRFYRAAEVQQHAIQGTGLGLSIVKQIVERHDGSVAVRSRHGEGTAISLTIPLARTPEV